MQIKTVGAFELWLGTTKLASPADLAAAIQAANDHAQLHGPATYLIRQPMLGVVMSKAYGVLAPGSSAIIPPSTPQSTVLDTNTIGQITFHWAAVSQGTYPVAGYQIYRNGNPIGSPTTLPSYTDNTVAQGVSYSYQIVAFDTQGNNSALSNPLVVLAASAIAPSWVTAIPAQQAIANQAFTLELSASVSNPNGLALTYSIASGALPAGISLNTSTGRVSGTATALGTSTPAFKISDGTDPPATSAAVTFTVVNPDTVAPNVPLGTSVQANAVNLITIGGFTPSDSSPPNADWKGTAQLNIKRTPPGSVIDKVTLAKGNQPVFTLGDIGPQTSTLSQSGADLTIGTTARDNPYPTVDGWGGGYQQISGRNWVLSCQVSAFVAANGFSNVRLAARASPDPTSAYVAAVCQPFSQGNGFFGEIRAQLGGNIAKLTSVANSASPAWLFLVRNGDTYSTYFSLDGNTLTSLGSATQVMGDTVYAWAAGNTNDGVAINVTLQQVSLQTIANWTYNDTTVVPGTAYSYQVDSQDAGGNISAFGTAVAATAVASASTKLHPGKYIYSGQHINSQSDVTATLAEIDEVLTSANVDGFCAVFRWPALEGAQDDYTGLALLDQIRQYMVTKYPTKRLMITIGTTNSFGADAGHINSVVPAYITGNGTPSDYTAKSAIYGAGYDGLHAGYWSGNGNSIAIGAWWRSAFEARFIKLYRTIANRVSPYGNGTTYDTDPFFELVTPGESSAGFTSVPSEYANSGIAGPAINTAFQQLMADLRGAFKYTLVLAQINFLPYQNAANLIAPVNAAANGKIAFGGPDIFVGASNYTQGQNAFLGVTAGSTDQRGKTASIALIEYPDFDISGVTLASLWDTAVNVFKASHVLFALRNDTGIDDFKTKLDPFLAANQIPTANKVCPTNFDSCNIA